MDVNAVADALGAAANTISDLSGHGFMADAVSPPAFYVVEVEGEFDKTFVRGMDDLVFTCRLLVSNANDRSSQSALREYLAGSGAKSVKQALQADRTLGGACSSLHVMRFNGYGLYEHNGTKYLGAEFAVRVIGSGS